jgi:ornithine--oxo-acid transaminase
VLSKETHDTVIRFAPPLTITRALIDRAIESFRKICLEKSRTLAIKSAAPRSPRDATVTMETSAA